MAFTKVPKIKFVILIAGAKFLGFKFGQPKLAVNAFSSPVQCPSLHIIGQHKIQKLCITSIVYKLPRKEYKIKLMVSIINLEA